MKLRIALLYLIGLLLAGVFILPAFGQNGLIVSGGPFGAGYPGSDSLSLASALSSAFTLTMTNSQQQQTNWKFDNGTNQLYLGVSRNGGGGTFGTNADGYINSVNVALNLGSGNVKGISISTSGLVTIATTLNSGSNCSSSASPAVCAAAFAGSALVQASSTSVLVNTTAVTANSQIIVTEDMSLGTKLSSTCNTQSQLVLGAPRVTARSAGTNFTVAVDVAPTSNPVCFSYTIIN